MTRTTWPVRWSPFSTCVPRLLSRAGWRGRGLLPDHCSRAVAHSFLVIAIFAGMARADGIHSTLMDAQKAFDQAHYNQALKLYEQANAAESGHAAIEYDMALCHLKLGDADKATQQFESVASRTGVSRSLRRDAFYDIGLIRARAARRSPRRAASTRGRGRRSAPGARS